MRILTAFAALCTCCLLAMGAKNGAPEPKTNPAVYTLLVHHDECTECGDFEIDSGEVAVPVELRSSYIEACVKSPRFGKFPDKRSRLLASNSSRGYRVGNVKLETEEAFDSLFLLPGKRRSDYLTGNPWDFNRRYRVTGKIVGIKWSYLTFKVQKAVLLPIKTNRTVEK